MKQYDQLMLNFTGDKAGLKKQLQEWCEKSRQSMNGTVLGLISNHLKEENKRLK